MSKKPKKSDSKLTLKEREEMALRLLKDNGYSEEEAQKIIDRAFYEEVPA